MQTIDMDQHQEIYSVSRLNDEVRLLLEETFPRVWVEGEISNFAAPGSGHWYFSLKDSMAQVKCAMFRTSQRGLGFTPKDGMHVLIRARVSLYPNRGDYQLIADFMEERGEGKLRRAYELLKKKLEAAGLFDATHKKPFPAFPRQIGVVTSSTGAAIRDILTVLKRRFACVPVIIYPTLVQGETAAPTIVRAIQIANMRNECDVLIVARGGGSLEDLWPFNEEIVAKAIYESRIPIISGVGHEVDFTIADFVADRRAPTPSAAAEILTPDILEMMQVLIRSRQAIVRHMLNQMKTHKQHLVFTQKHLYQQHPKNRLTQKMQLLDNIEMKLTQLQTRLLVRLREKLQMFSSRLQQQIPLHKIRQTSNHMIFSRQQFIHLANVQINRKKTMLANAAAKLDALSPLATLRRGYAIAMTQEQHVLRAASEVKPGDDIRVRLAQGSLECKVAKVNEAS
jgi:exodeoxyribonuclease VII large subunit